MIKVGLYRSVITGNVVEVKKIDEEGYIHFDYQGAYHVWAPDMFKEMKLEPMHDVHSNFK